MGFYEVLFFFFFFVIFAFREDPFFQIQVTMLLETGVQTPQRAIFHLEKNGRGLDLKPWAFPFVLGFVFFLRESFFFVCSRNAKGGEGYYLKKTNLIIVLGKTGRGGAKNGACYLN